MHDEGAFMIRDIVITLCCLRAIGTVSLPDAEKLVCTSHMLLPALLFADVAVLLQS